MSTIGYATSKVGRMNDPDGITYDLWHFQSTKTGRKYHVRIEFYHEHVLSVKFYPAQYKKNKDRYCILTNDNEPRTIVMTVIGIMMTYFENDPKSSFVFTGSPTLKEYSNYCTKRFRFYRIIISLLISDRLFYHLFNEQYSLYMLLRKSEVDNGSIQQTKILEFYTTQMVELEDGGTML